MKAGASREENAQKKLRGKWDLRRKKKSKKTEVKDDPRLQWVCGWGDWGGGGRLGDMAEAYFPCQGPTVMCMNSRSAVGECGRASDSPLQELAPAPAASSSSPTSPKTQPLTPAPEPPGALITQVHLPTTER